ncbi:alpha-hydroxy-acid oxidizing protein, partial [Rhizobium ruizarguesonis]
KNIPFFINARTDLFLAESDLSKHAGLVDDAIERGRAYAAAGCSGIVLSNHGGRQLDGSRSAFDQLAEIVDAVGDRIDVMMDGGVKRGT